MDRGLIKVYETRDEESINRLVEVYSLNHNLGHLDYVTSIIASLEGDLIFSASMDHTIKVWDSQNGFLKRLLIWSLDSPINFVDSIDQYVFFRQPNSPNFWSINIKEGMIKRTSKAKIDRVHNNAIQHIDIRNFLANEENFSSLFIETATISSDQRFLACGMKGGFLKIWDIKSGILLDSIKVLEVTDITTICFLPNSSSIVFGDSNGTIMLWDLKNNRSIWQIFGRKGKPLIRLVFPNLKANSIIAFTNERKIIYWKLSSPTYREFLDLGMSNVPYASSFSPDCDLLAIAGTNGTVIIYDLAKERIIHTFYVEQEEIRPIIMKWGKNLILIGSSLRSLKVWNIDPPKSFTLPAFRNDIVVREIEDIALTQDATIAYVILPCSSYLDDRNTQYQNLLEEICWGDENSCYFDVLLEWDLKHNEINKFLKSYDTAFRRLAISEKMGYCAIGNGQAIEIRDLKTLRNHFILGRHNEDVNCISISPSGNLIASGDRQGLIKVWEIDNHSLITKFLIAGIVDKIHFMSDNKTLIAGNTLGELYTSKLLF